MFCERVGYGLASVVGQHGTMGKEHSWTVGLDDSCLLCVAMDCLSKVVGIDWAKSLMESEATYESLSRDRPDARIRALPTLYLCLV